MDTNAINNPIFLEDAENQEVTKSEANVQAHRGRNRIDAKKLIIYSEIMRPKFDE